MNRMRVLAGDIGGTKTLLQVAECGVTGCRAIRKQWFDSKAYRSLSAVIRAFLGDKELGKIRAACFGIAGPVKHTASGQNVKVTNLPWQISSRDLRRQFGFTRLRLINDFEAVAYGIEALGRKSFTVLQKGTPAKHGTRAVIGAGTGLGQGILAWHKDHYEPIATEGGHANFAPVNPLQIELARFLLKTAGRTSWELVLSGHGLVRLYVFLREQGVAPESPVLAQAMRKEDPAAAITQAALEQGDPLANQALDLFVDIYGAQAGNLALTAGATGGVYIAGGIAPKMISRLADGRFIRAFNNKGKMSPYAQAIPVRLVADPEVGLTGAALAAARLK